MLPPSHSVPRWLLVVRFRVKSICATQSGHREYRGSEVLLDDARHELFTISVEKHDKLARLSTGPETLPGVLKEDPPLLLADWFEIPLMHPSTKGKAAC